MNLASIDLNLLVVFDALLQERNVTRAGQRVGLTQPAVSNALSRLRLLFKDELFVRTPEGMQPTSRALEIAAPLQHALAQITEAMEPARFDPATARVSFALAASDYVSSTLLPPLTRLVRERAPMVRLRVVPINTQDVLRLLDTGQSDLAIGLFDGIPERLDGMPVWEEGIVLVARPDHPLGRAPLTLERLGSVPHIMVSQTGQEDDGSSDGFVLVQGLRMNVMARSHIALRRRMEELGINLHVALTVPYYSAVLPIILHSDLVSLLPRRVAMAYRRLIGLTVQELPCGVPSARIEAIWHRQATHRPAHRWLRETIGEAARVLDETG